MSRGWSAESDLTLYETDTDLLERAQQRAVKCGGTGESETGEAEGAEAAQPRQEVAQE